MKKIDYIFENIDLTKFLKKLDRSRPRLLVDLENDIYKSTSKFKRTDTDESFDFQFLMLDLIKNSTFFSNFKEFKVFFYAMSNQLEKSFEFEGETTKEPTGYNICYCFYSKLDNKYRLLDISIHRNNSYIDSYQITSFKKKPTIKKILSSMKDKNSTQIPMPKIDKQFKKEHNKAFKQML
tara:strand:+ start:44 stop:583 length:540 start_codon:yes stop_codon:yes gene_type:complete